MVKVMDMEGDARMGVVQEGRDQGEGGKYCRWRRSTGIEANDGMNLKEIEARDGGNGRK